MKIKLRHVGAMVCLTCVAVASGAAMEDAAVKDYAGYPQPDAGYVTDLANLLTDAQETHLESWLYDCEKEKGVEMAVVTIGSITDYPDTANSSVAAFATGLFSTYGIGNMPKNDGVLLLVAVNDREARIELGDGYGSDRDRDAERIMQNVIVPQFRNGRYDRGILEGAKSILKTFAGKEVTAGSRAVPPAPQDTANAQEAQPTPTAAPIPTASPGQNASPVYTPRPVQHIQPGRNPVGFGGTGLLIGLVFVGIAVMVILGVVKMVTGGGASRSYGAGNSMIGLDDDGVVPDGGYNRGFWNGLFLGQMGRQGLHNGGIHFGGRASHNRGAGFGSSHSGSNFGGGFGGGHSGGSHSSFGGGFSRGGGATGKW